MKLASIAFAIATTLGVATTGTNAMPVAPAVDLAPIASEVGVRIYLGGGYGHRRYGHRRHHGHKHRHRHCRKIRHRHGGSRHSHRRCFKHRHRHRHGHHH